VGGLKQTLRRFGSIDRKEGRKKPKMRKRAFRKKGCATNGFKGLLTLDHPAQENQGGLISLPLTCGKKKENSIERWKVIFNQIKVSIGKESLGLERG